MLYSRSSESQRVSKTWRRPYRPISSWKNCNTDQAVSNCQGNPIRIHRLEQPVGLLCSFKVLQILSTHDCMAWHAKQKVNRSNSYEKHMANLREPPDGWSCESAKQPETCEKHGVVGKTVQGVRKLLNKRRKISHEVIPDCESTLT